MRNSQQTPSNIDHNVKVAAGEPLPRVLVVDDEESITELVSMALRYEGFDVQTASSGYGALEQIDSFRPDLILLDVMLPDIDGFNIAERLRRDRRDIPVLFLTARDATEDKVRGLTIGGDQGNDYERAQDGDEPDLQRHEQPQMPLLTPESHT